MNNKGADQTARIRSMICACVVLQVFFRRVSYSFTSQHIQELLGPFFKYKNAIFNGVQKNESIICVRMG